jgi:chromosome segregation ATPase
MYSFYNKKSIKILIAILAFLIVMIFILNLTSCGAAPTGSSTPVVLTQENINAITAVAVEKAKKEQEELYNKKLQEAKAGLNTDQVSTIKHLQEQLKAAKKVQAISEEQLAENKAKIEELTRKFEIEIKPIDDEISKVKRQISKVKREIKSETDQLQVQIKQHNDAVKELKTQVEQLTVPLQNKVGELEAKKQELNFKREYMLAIFKESTEKLAPPEYKIASNDK